MSNHLRTLAATLGALALATVGLTGCSTGADTLTVSASATPHAEILDYLEESGQLPTVDLRVETISGEVDPNQLLEAGDVDANYFQHEPYLDDWQVQNGTDDLVTVAATHIEPMAVYSGAHASLAEIPDGATIAVPRDPTNYARALYVLEGAGLLTMAEPAATANLSTITVDDVAGNPKDLSFVELDRAQLPRSLDDPAVAAAVINSNYALEAGLSPATDGLYVEAEDGNPYANFLVTTKDKAQDPAVQELVAALESPRTAAWIQQTYGDSLVVLHADAS